MKARLQYWFLLWVAVFVLVAFDIQQAQVAPYPANWFDWLRLILVSSWVIPLPMAIIGLWGVLRYRRRVLSTPLRQPLVFRVVTRGDNVAAVKRTLANIYSTMRSLDPLPLEWTVEVVTDRPLRLREQLVVPAKYQTPNGAKWKARALQYAVENSPAVGWVLHLDEESQIDADTVYGAAQFMLEHPGAIGQGAILYNRELRSNRWLTLADSLRTGDDIGRFYLQYKRGGCQFGMHGSFILAPIEVERAVGFDFPPELCVTEDAYFGLKALEMGYKFGWIEGFIYEQSPRTVEDFLKQRRRWYLGVRQVVWGPLAWRTKVVLWASTLGWSGSILVLLATLVNLIFPIHVTPWVSLGGDLSLAIYLSMYMAGLHLNLLPEMSWTSRMKHYALLIVSVPIFSLMECAGVAYALARPKLGFEVIGKD